MATKVNTPLTKTHDIIPSFMPTKTPNTEKKPTNSLEQWAHSLFDSDQNSDSQQSPTTALARFGLKNAKDVIQFLNSPAGETVVGEIGAQVALEQAIQSNNQQEQRQHELLVHRLKVALFLWFLEDKVHAIDTMRELILEQNQKAIAQAKTPIHQPPPTSNPQLEVLEKVLTGYNIAIDLAQNKQNALFSEEATLQEQKQQLYNLGQLLHSKYADYEQEMNSVGKDWNIDTINHHIEELIKEMTAHVDTINKIIEMNAEATKLLNHHNGLNLKLVHLYDMKEVHLEHKYYADAKGKPITSFEDAFKNAVFVLNNSQKIINDNGQYYLLKAGQNWDEIKHSPDSTAREQAKMDYESSKKEIMSVKNVVLINKGLETTIHTDRVQETEKKIQHNVAEQSLISNQINLLQAARANAQSMATDLNKTQTAPTPTLTPASSSKAHQASPTRHYGEQIRRLKESKQISINDLQNLVNQAPLNNRENAQLYLTSLSLKGAISQQTMQMLLKNFARFGIDTTRPAVTSIKTPMELQQDSTAPNPFKTNPFQ
jgi:effector protein LidA